MGTIRAPGCENCAAAEDDLHAYVKADRPDDAQATQVSLAALTAWGAHEDDEDCDLFSVGSMTLLPHRTRPDLSWHSVAKRLARLHLAITQAE